MPLSLAIHRPFRRPSLRAGLIATAVLMLAACGPTPEEQHAMDSGKCSGFGFTPGTDTFAHCMLSVTQQREAQQAADQRAAAAQAAADRRAQAAQNAARDRADQDAWDRRTGQGAYSSPSWSSPSGSSPSASASFGSSPVNAIRNQIYDEQRKAEGFQ